MKSVSSYRLLNYKVLHLKLYTRLLVLKFQLNSLEIQFDGHHFEMDDCETETLPLHKL